MEMSMEGDTSMNKQVVLYSYVKGYPKVTNFALKHFETSNFTLQTGSNAILLKNLYISCDPYLRHRLADHTSHPNTIVHSFNPGDVIKGYGVSKVINSTHPDFKNGDFVWGLTGWEVYSVNQNPQAVFKIGHPLRLSYYLGVLGMPGITAYVGFFIKCCPKAGETVYVSSAAGGVGQLVGQFARIAGCYVVGSASTLEKVTLMKEKLGYHDAFNYKDEPDLGVAFKRYFPNGIDIYFDNVGGYMLDEVVLHMNPHGRIAACGMISQYNLDKPEGLCNMFNVVMKSIEMKGFIETDYRHVYEEYLDFAIEKLKDGKLVYVEDIEEGLENAASALVGIFYGVNVGRKIVRIASEKIVRIAFE